MRGSGMDALSTALDLGEQMLICGAEVRRVEDTVGRIGRAYGAKRADVFSVTSSIVATLDMGGGALFTQTRRIHDQKIDLSRLDRLNALSREICLNRPERGEVCAALERMRELPGYDPAQQCLIYALISGAFSLFFGGGAMDALLSAVIGAGLRVVVGAAEGMRLNRILAGSLGAFAGGALAMLAVRLGLQVSFDKVAIGNIMLLTPGLTLTNALTDMLSGDTLAGLIRLIEAMVTAVAIALGFALAGGLL
ncbi:MAG: threonine/serine exporter family protein, partial [Christensenellaceae bacterium]|nr:threonine/serine exporter family protein [Christensenellaceae bacterium]